MRKRIDWLIVLLFVALLCVTVGCASNAKGASSDKKSYYGPLRVKGAYLTDQKGNRVILKGISTHGLQWFPEYVNDKAFSDLHDTFHMNLVRLALYTDENGYCSGGDKKELEKIIDRGVKAATRHQMYVIIDWHVLHDLTPKKYEKQAKSFFRKMARKYRKNPHVLYEICNEPNGGTGWSEIRSYAKKIIPIIHKYNKNAVILVGTPTWSQDILDAAADPLPKTKKYKNVMYTLHFYAATHTDDLRAKLRQAHEKKLPVFVSEFGICDASGNGRIDQKQANKWMKLLDQYKISFANWSLCNKDEAASFLKPSCQKRAGFKISDLSTSGKWLVKVIAGKNTTGGKDKASTSREDSKGEKSRDTGGTSETDQKTSGAGILKSTKAGEGLSVSARAENSWQSNGKHFLQYKISIQNTAATEVEGWKVHLTFHKRVKVKNSWNGKAVADGKKVTITPVSYNRRIAAGKEICDVGVILYY